MRRRADIGNMLGSPLDYSRSAAPIECAGIRSALASAEKRDEVAFLTRNQRRGYVRSAKIMALEKQG